MALLGGLIVAKFKVTNYQLRTRSTNYQLPTIKYELRTIMSACANNPVSTVSDGLETFTIELLSIHFRSLRHHVLLSIYDVIQSPQFLGIMWRMRKQSIPGPSSVRPGIEAKLRHTSLNSKIHTPLHSLLKSASIYML